MEIPGYKFDPEKNRYFKVLSTGQLPGGEYTIAALAETNRARRRQIAQERAEQYETETDKPLLRQNVFEYKKLGRRPTRVYSGSPEELISSIFITHSNKLITGSRNGIISVGASRKTAEGRSIVAIEEVSHNVVAAAVDNEYGSIVATDTGSIHLPREFVTSACSLHESDNLLVGSQRGVTLWNMVENDTEVLPVGSVNAVAASHDTQQLAFAGLKSGELQLLDLRTEEVQRVGKFRKAVTNIGTLRDSKLVVATGLEDEMLLYDLRNTSSPVVDFAQYRNWSTVRHGFAVNDARTAVVVAMDTGELTVFDAIVGKPLGPVHYHGAKRTGQPNDTTAPAPEPVSPSMAWPSDGLFIASMNTVCEMTPRQRSEEMWATPAETACVARIHQVLNSKVVTY